MPLFYSSITQVEPMAVGWVANADDMQVAVVCRRDTFTGKWHPLYGVRHVDSKRIDLPHCFTLEPLAEEALENALIAKQEGLTD